MNPRGQRRCESPEPMPLAMILLYDAATQMQYTLQDIAPFILTETDLIGGVEVKFKITWPPVCVAGENKSVKMAFFRACHRLTQIRPTAYNYRSAPPSYQLPLNITSSLVLLMLQVVVWQLDTLHKKY